MKVLLSKWLRLLLLCLLCCGSLARAQSPTIQGTVTDAKDGTPLVGVTVAVKGKSIGTQTDANGHYQLKVPDPQAILLFSFIGYAQQEHPVGGRNMLNIKLGDDQKKLEEVVVVGYGAQKKKDVTGAISSVNAASIREVPVTNAQQALQGRAPGIEVLNNSNKPGDEPRVRVRGNRSLTAGNDPLYVVDGIPFAGNLNDLNPRDIASMEVLKDASATAIYGSRGANGVILVTLQKGRTGPPVVSYSGSYGVSRQLSNTDMMNAQQYIAMKKEAYRAANLNDADEAIFTPVELANVRKGTNTNWQDLLLSPGYQTNHALSVAGGSDKTKYAFSGGYFRDQGVLKLQNYERYNLHIGIDQQIGKRVRTGVSLTGTYSTRNGETYNGMGAALKMLPIAAPYDDQGKLITYPTGDSQQPNALLDYEPGNRIEKRTRVRLFASLYGEVDILDGLKYRLNVGPDVQQNNYGRFQGKNNTDLLIGGGDATANKDGQFVWAYTVENILNYNKVFNKKHALNVTALYSVQRQREDTSTAAVRGIPVESQEYYNLGQALAVTGIGSQLGSWTILSYMGRINYTFDDRFLATLTLRADGSSRFAPGKQWGYFPSVALGWNLSQEQFIRNARFIDNLKLRVSYGKIGNTGIPPYATQGGLNRLPYSFGNKGVLGFQPNQPRNPNLTWETTTSFNAGIDFAFLKNRISGSIDIYQQRTTDLLLQRFLPFSNGFNSVLENLGSTQNRGLEIALSGAIIDNPKGFSWSADANFFFNRERILTLIDGKKDVPGNSWFIGYPTQVYYDFEKIGIWQDEKDAQVYGQRQGEIRLRDVDGNNRIDDKDRVILGSAQPKWSAGLTQRFSYKGFDLSIVAFARVGGMIRSDFYQDYNTLFGRYNNLNISYWTPTNHTNDFPRPNRFQERPNYNSTLSYFDGSFFKIRNISLGYSLPESLMKNWGMQALRVNVDVKQPLILAPYRQKYKGIDPEDVNTIGVDAPATWMLQFGINARF
ncbi:TonB-dependent receptor [Chitinophaga pendula]|uniref:SusC/RagA family TonB-linked outer membrane protein n=1 Tax=Chitinophaga TaxID=79328 RepID=UPI000BB01156|nr:MULTISPECIES: TonB-dependent receptor [Chitinophaga]ASZ09763.1 SusC/RagA family TonB-linked outer membrane protein [Chitinophaga sp. MD30]UCJ07297.1 TonB-dependent receptor [Chitinophaga pendula]